jgi:hypothetical protein
MTDDTANTIPDPAQSKPASSLNLSPDIKASVDAIRNKLMDNGGAAKLDGMLQQSQEQRSKLVMPNGIALAGLDAQPTEEHPHSSKINYEAGSSLTEAVFGNDRNGIDPARNPDVAALAYLAQKGGMQPEDCSWI